MSSSLLRLKYKIQRLLNKQFFIRYRILICCILAIFIILFSVFGLSNESIYEENIANMTVEDKDFKNYKNKKLQNDENYETNDYPMIENLIILPCHSVFAPELNSNINGDFDSDDIAKSDRFSIALNPKNWILESFQIESDDQISFLKHLELSLLELHENIGNSALVISGGFTKKQIKKSESSSYLELAEKVGFLKSPYFKKGANILLDEYARDSYENILYSICTFYNRFNKFPQKITIIGFGFKRERFLSSHLVTLGYYSVPSINDNNIKIDNLPDTKHVKYINSGPFLDNIKETMTDSQFEQYQTKFFDSLYENEKKNALDLFIENPFGSKNSLLHDKKLKRDPWNTHNEISYIYKMDNDILNYLIAIDQLEIENAWKLYQSKILPNFPLYEQ